MTITSTRADPAIGQIGIPQNSTLTFYDDINGLRNFFCKFIRMAAKESAQ